MPESGRGTGPGGTEALAAEIERARGLLALEREVEEALRGGISGDDLLPLIHRQEAAAREAAQAARQRRSFFSDEASLEEWLIGRPPGESQRIRALMEEAGSLRRELAAAARRCRYLAERALEWSQGQMDVMVRAATNDQTTYCAQNGRPRKNPGPAVMDRAA